jgi:kynureninase
MAAHKASVDLFNEVGMEKLRNKSISLTQYHRVYYKSNK